MPQDLTDSAARIPAMKQTLFMIVLTLIGVGGALLIEPFWGVLVYDFFAVLRPQYLWDWALPMNIGWSGYVAWTTLVATLLTSMFSGQPSSTPRFSFAHKAYFAFGGWICLTYTTSRNQEVAWFWFLEYLKIFIMFGVGSIVIQNVRQVWWI